MNNQNYIVATIHSWNIEKFDLVLKKYPGNWHLITNNNELTIEKVKEINPKYIFFPHWSWMVSSEIIEYVECVCFHSTDLPYGRGGSPIQNLIIRGHENTKISAIKMVKELDAGPIYLKSELSLIGRAQEIFERAAKIISEMIFKIIIENPIPTKQVGEIVVFQRKKDNELPRSGTSKEMYNHIRMLDADGYPNAYIRYGNFILKFSDANFDGEDVYANVKIIRDLKK